MKHDEMIRVLSVLVGDHKEYGRTHAVQALTAAIDALRWRDPVKEPPKAFMSVLLKRNNRDELIGYLGSDDVYRADTGDEVGDIVYWLPLPQFPEVE